MGLDEDIVDLYRRAACELPADVMSSLSLAFDAEDDEKAKNVLGSILENARLAREGKRPICQDTGIPYFYVGCPAGIDRREIRAVIDAATDNATSGVPLRPNAFECVTGECVGNRAVVHFYDSDKFRVDLLLKGGGSENVSRVYKLPDTGLSAHRDLDGVRKCVIDAVFQAQGQGCPPYILGVGLGGSIEDAAHLSKMQLLRNLADENPVHELKDLEVRALSDINSLGIGPLGLGGKTTALAVKAASGFRHPASFFVGVSVGCWCMRRGFIDID